MTEPVRPLEALKIAEAIVRGHEHFCAGHTDPEQPWCSCAPGGMPLCVACSKLRDAIAAALLQAAAPPPAQTAECGNFTPLKDGLKAPTIADHYGHGWKAGRESAAAPDPLQGIRDAKYLNPVCAADGCQWLRVTAPLSAPNYELKEMVRHLCHFDWCAQNQDAYPWAWRDGDAERCDCGLSALVAGLEKWVKL